MATSKKDKKSYEEVMELYAKVISSSPSPIESSIEPLVFLWMYFFVQGVMDRKSLTNVLIGININPLDVSYFIEELEIKRSVLKTHILPIKYTGK